MTVGENKSVAEEEAEVLPPPLPPLPPLPSPPVSVGVGERVSGAVGDESKVGDTALEGVAELLASRDGDAKGEEDLAGVLVGVPPVAVGVRVSVPAKEGEDESVGVLQAVGLAATVEDGVGLGVEDGVPSAAPLLVAVGWGDTLVLGEAEARAVSVRGGVGVPEAVEDREKAEEGETVGRVDGEGEDVAGALGVVSREALRVGLLVDVTDAVSVPPRKKERVGVAVLQAVPLDSVLRVAVGETEVVPKSKEGVGVRETEGREVAVRVPALAARLAVGSPTVGVGEALPPPAYAAEGLLRGLREVEAVPAATVALLLPTPVPLALKDWSGVTKGVADGEGVPPLLCVAVEHALEGTVAEGQGVGKREAVGVFEGRREGVRVTVTVPAGSEGVDREEGETEERGDADAVSKDVEVGVPAPAAAPAEGEADWHPEAESVGRRAVLVGEREEVPQALRAELPVLVPPVKCEGVLRSASEAEAAPLRDCCQLVDCEGEEDEQGDGAIPVGEAVTVCVGASGEVVGAYKGVREGLRVSPAAAATPPRLAVGATPVAVGGEEVESLTLGLGEGVGEARRSREGVGVPPEGERLEEAEAVGLGEEVSQLIRV